jgi:hypothetical protein
MTFVAGIALLLFGAILAFWMKPDGRRHLRPAAGSTSQ